MEPMIGIDKARKRRRSLKSYFNTLARTELMNAARASYDDKVTEEGFDVMKLTTSGHCCDACARFEGELFSLTGATKGLPSKEDLIEAGVFHPNCTHSYSLVPAYITETKYGIKSMTSEEFSKTPMAGKKLIHGPHSAEKDAELTNPNFDPLWRTKDYNCNCQRCVATYEARRRGYDVEALPRILDSSGNPDKNDTTANNWENLFENPKWELESGSAFKTPRAFVNNTALSYGDGSRCIVYVKWRQKPIAHVFIVENHGGKLAYIDHQTGNMNCSGHLTIAEKGFTRICRIDNLEFSDYIMGCCKNRRL